MSTIDALIGWLKVLAVWAAVGVFFGILGGVAIVVARAVIALLWGAS